MEGQYLGDYHLIRHLGGGALGNTYLAEHRFLKKQFVLKVLDSELVKDKDFLHRFKQEAAKLATLDHPHIVKIHNITETDGYYYLVTDSVIDETGESTNLYSYMHQRKNLLSEELILSIAKQVADALDYSHLHNPSHVGFAHLSLKPTNILIQKKEKLTIQISDFGLSKVMGPSNYMSRIYQLLAHKMGQPPEKLPLNQLSFLHHYLFLAPEQKWNYKDSCGMKCDIYTYGALLYFLLTHQYPEGIYEFPSHLERHYKLPWNSIIKECLLLDPEKRPSSLSKLLQEFSEHKTVDTSPELPLRFKPLLKPTEIHKPEFEPDPGAIFQTELVVSHYEPKPQEKKETQLIFTEMVIIPGGNYERGSNRGGRDEIPKHQVTLDPFAIDIHPVTNEQFVQFLEVLGGEKDHQNNDVIRLRESRIKKTGGKLMIESGYSRHPVVGVTYYGAIAYAKWAGKRLPTEAEWEIAACGGLKEHLYPTGKDIDRTQANFFSSDTTPVMSYPPNVAGIYDLAGNVYEWCLDWYDYHYYHTSLQEPINPKGPSQGVYRVLRGGCWKSLKEDLRCAHRHRNNPGTVNGTYGFRCAADVISQD